MRLFISYARVDKHYCTQIIDLLDTHEIWYDRRLHVGQKWWDEIARRLRWAQGFVYLLSPESISSQYCQKEMDIARRLGKKIFPVIIQPRTPIPDALLEYQYADFSNGLTVQAVKSLLDAIYLSDKGEPMPSPVPAHNGDGIDERPLLDLQLSTGEDADDSAAVHRILHEIGDAMDEENYDQAVFLLKQLIENRIRLDMIDLPLLLKEAERALERQAYERQANREYHAIQVLLAHPSTREMGERAYHRFQEQFKDYDPTEKAASVHVMSTMELPQLAASSSSDDEEAHIDSKEDDLPNTSAAFSSYDAPPEEYRNGNGSKATVEPQPMLVVTPDKTLLTDLCYVPWGQVQIAGAAQPQSVESFFISKFPVTNEEFSRFVQTPDGYQNAAWWRYSRSAYEWHLQHPRPLDTHFREPQQPRTNVCWYEAVAYTLWLEHQTGIAVRLPSVLQWQRAAQGDEGYLYPWGNEFSTEHCNTKEGRKQGVCPVDAFPSGASPFGVMDMAGNVWEWCKNGAKRGEATFRIVKGGSFMSPHTKAQSPFNQYLQPEYRYSSIGFRVVLAD